MEKLGEGANGVVRKCQDKITKEIFAVKMGKM
jgi:serine/threonine protein kinase